MKSQIIIPARLHSTRLPEKLLLAETGKPLLQHTYESAQRARRPAGICVAADDERIAEVVRAFGGQVVMTDPEAASGTDRVAEVASKRDVDPSQIALAWLMSRPGVSSPIVGMTKIEHLDAAIAALEIQLDSQECVWLEEPYVPHPILGLT